NGTAAAASAARRSRPHAVDPRCFPSRRVEPQAESVRPPASVTAHLAATPRVDAFFFGRKVTGLDPFFTKYPNPLSRLRLCGRAKMRPIGPMGPIGPILIGPIGLIRPIGLMR